MKEYYELFKTLLEEEKKEEAFSFVMELLKDQKVDVVELYGSVLTPALNNMECRLDDRKICVWKEHVKTAIVRTIVECCYPYVLEKKKELNYPQKGTAVIICPPEEYHDLGARMAADFFAICGYQSIFVGGNTPYQDFYQAIDVICPEIVAISVSNYYNLIATERIIQELREKGQKSLKIVAGGYAFMRHPDNFRLVGADYQVQTFSDIEKLAKGGETL